LEGHEFFRGKAGTQIAQVGKAADKKAGTDQEQKREGHLGNDEAFSQAMVAAARRRRLRLDPSKFQRGWAWWSATRGQGQNDSGEDGDGEVEEKNAEIGRTGNIHAAGIGGQIDFHEGAVGPKRYGETSDSPERGKRKTLDQELADDAAGRWRPSLGATAISFHAAGAPNEHEIGKVGASDEQDRPQWWPLKPREEW